MTVAVLDRDAVRRGYAQTAQELTRALSEAAQTRHEVGIDVLGFASDSVAETRAQAGSTVLVYGDTALIHVRGEDGGPCPVCLETAWRRVQGGELYDALESGAKTNAPGGATRLVGFAIQVLALVLERLVLEEPRAERGRSRIASLDLRTLRVSRIVLLADPECAACGSPADESGPADRFAGKGSTKPDPARFHLRRPSEYGLDVAGLLNPTCGLLGRGALFDLDSPTTASCTGSSATRTAFGVHDSYWGGHASSYSESLDIGVLEALERYAGSRPHGGVRLTTASAQELRRRGTAFVDPAVCGTYGEEYYRAYPGAARYDPSQPIRWVDGYSLRDRHPVLVPEILGYYDAAGLPERFVQECSNGCASGSSAVEAALHGLFELIERDAFLLAWFGQVALPELDPHSSRRADVRLLVERLALCGFRARIFDATMDLRVPVAIAVAERPEDPEGGMCFGAGASLDPDSAVLGALVEIASDAPYLRRRVDRRRDELAGMAADFSRVTALHDHPHVYGVPGMRRHTSFLLGPPGSAPGPLAPIGAPRAGRPPALTPTLDLREDLDQCVQSLAGAGFDTVVVDQTVPVQRAHGVHTVTVLAPGLLPIDFGMLRQRALGMPRLRSGLRAAGYRAHDLDPTEAHRAPHPFP